MINLDRTIFELHNIESEKSRAVTIILTMNHPNVLRLFDTKLYNQQKYIKGETLILKLSDTIYARVHE